MGQANCLQRQPHNRPLKPQDPQTWSFPLLGPKFLEISVPGAELSGASFPDTHTNELTSHSRCQDTRRLRENLWRGGMEEWGSLTGGGESLTRLGLKVGHFFLVRH